MQRLISALAEYDRTEPARERMMDTAETEQDVARWEEAKRAALGQVQEAFYQITQSVNSREKCSLLSLDDARRFAGGPPESEKHWYPTLEQRIGRNWP